MASQYIHWNECYDLGIQAIDEQHCNLIEIINRLYKAFNAQQSLEELDEIFVEMNRYADCHFKTEEQLFEQHKISDIQEHIKEHKEYLQKVKGFEDTLLQDVNIDFGLLSFLKKWWTDHILSSDKAYAEQILNK